MYVYLYIDAPSNNHFFREKASSITFFERALVIQHAKHMRHVIFSSVACPAGQYFYTLSHKRHDIETKVHHHRHVHEGLGAFPVP